VPDQWECFNAGGDNEVHHVLDNDERNDIEIWGYGHTISYKAVLLTRRRERRVAQPDEIKGASGPGSLSYG
jgi:hypothetical protein